MSDTPPGAKTQAALEALINTKVRQALEEADRKRSMHDWTMGGELVWRCRKCGQASFGWGFSGQCRA